MGHVHLQVFLTNPMCPDVGLYQCAAIVDAGVYLRLPRQVADQLGLGSNDSRVMSSAR
jgi:hypothetical protein